MKKTTPNVYLVAIEKYRKEILEGQASGDKEKVKDAKWKIKYFKDKIRQRKKND